MYSSIVASLPTVGVLATPPIPVGDHIKSSGLDIDTIYTTCAVGILIVVSGLILRRKVTSGVPGKLQLGWETVTESLGDLVEENLGPRYRHVIPLAVTIFLLVLFANWVEVLPGVWHNTDWAPSPTADVNLTYALAIVVFVVTNVEAVRAKGVKKYFANFVRKPRPMAPLHVIEELVKPVTLSLRLFGNIFSGGIMIALLLALPIKLGLGGVVFGILSFAGTVVWKLFDMFIGVIQAFIFSLLTVLYYQFAVSEEH